jgi:hypothetical protein
MLVPEYQRLGAWDLIQGTFSTSRNDLDSRIALQMVNESALCLNRLRKKDSLCNQGFSLVNGLSFLATDESVHKVLDSNSIVTYEALQIALMKIRRLQGHYSPEATLAVDPHRINSETHRTMPCKKKRPTEPAKKMLQTFFCVDAITGQPLAFTIGSSGRNCSQSTIQLMDLVQQGGIGNALAASDKEHFSSQITDFFRQNSALDIIMPAPEIKALTEKYRKMDYKLLWPGYAIADSTYTINKSIHELRLIVQREGECSRNYRYKGFLTTSKRDSADLLTSVFPMRWTIEEFFNFNGKMGWDRASTFNLNIRYGKQTLALIAQAATHELKNKLPGEYKNWTAEHLAQQVLTNMEGDIRVQDDTIIITYYRDHQKLNLRSHFENLPEKLTSQGIDPRIPWLYDYKLDFRFK